MSDVLLDPGKLFLYCYKHVKLNEFMTLQPVEYPPEFFAASTERFILLNKDKAAEQHLNEYRLFFVGAFVKKTGKFEILENPQEILDCLEVFNRE